MAIAAKIAKQTPLVSSGLPRYLKSDAAISVSHGMLKGNDFVEKVAQCTSRMISLRKTKCRRFDGWPVELRKFHGSVYTTHSIILLCWRWVRR